MDPDTTLEVIRSYIRAWHQGVPLSPAGYQDLMEHLDVLDRSLSDKGFLPEPWADSQKFGVWA